MNYLWGLILAHVLNLIIHNLSYKFLQLWIPTNVQLWQHAHKHLWFSPMFGGSFVLVSVFFQMFFFFYCRPRYLLMMKTCQCQVMSTGSVCLVQWSTKGSFIWHPWTSSSQLPWVSQRVSTNQKFTNHTNYILKTKYSLALRIYHWPKRMRVRFT